jgi:hypothetical protein
MTRLSSALVFIVAVLLTASWVLVAGQQTQVQRTSDPLIGTWTFNGGQSKYYVGAPPVASTIIFATWASRRKPNR